MSKQGVFSGAYFPVFGLNTEKYGPEKTLYLDTFHAVLDNWPVDPRNSFALKDCLFGAVKLTRNTIKRKFIHNS